MVFRVTTRRGEDVDTIAMTRRTKLQIEFNKSEKSLIHLKCRRRDIDQRKKVFFFRKFLIERNEDWKELRLFLSLGADCR